MMPDYLLLATVITYALAVLALGTVPLLLTVGMVLTFSALVPLLESAAEPMAVAGAATIALAAFKARRAQTITSRLPLLAYLPIGIATLGLAFSIFALDPSVTLRSSVNLFVLGLIALVVAKTIPSETVVASAFWATSLVVAVSIVSLLLGEWSGGTYDPSRSEGVLANPNTLGALAAIWVALSFSRSKSVIVTVLPLAAGLLVASGSRGGALAAAAAVLYGTWMAGGRQTQPQSRWLQRLVTVVIGGVALYLVLPLFFEGSSDLALLRTSDSGRAQALRDGWDLLLQRPWTGWGLGTRSVGQTAGPHLLPGSLGLQLGILGVAVAATIYASLIATYRGADLTLGALVSVALVGSLSESWMIGGGSGLAWVFWLPTIALAASRRSQSTRPAQRRDRPPAATSVG